MRTEGLKSSEAMGFFTGLSAGLRSAKIVFVATKLGVFDRLDARPASAQTLAPLLSCDPDSLQLLLRALVGLNVLTFEGGTFHNSELAARHLVAGKEQFAGNNLRFQDMLWECWTNLETVVRTGKPHRALPDLLGAEGQAFTTDYIRGMLPIAQVPSKVIAELLADAPMRTMIDVGCGPGAYALAMLERFPQLRATLFDLSFTLAVTRELVAKSPHKDRVELKEGDYLSDAYGTGYDLVLLSHTTHDESPRSVRNMIGRAFDALAPGGRLVIHDWVVDEETHSHPDWASLFAVNVMLYTNGGRVYSVGEYSAQMKDAGFASVSSKLVADPRIPNPTTIVIGTKTKTK